MTASGSPVAPPATGRLSALAKKLALAAGAALATLLALEACFRVFYTPRVKRPRMAVYQGVAKEWCCGPEGVRPDGIWGYEPSTEFKHCYDGDEHGYFDQDQCISYRINSSGYRDVEHTLAKPPDVYRILILGDSFTVGEGVPADLVFTRRLAQALQPKRAGGKRIEVLNLGLPGCDTRWETANYRRHGRQFQPDYVVVQWNTNDFPAREIHYEHQLLIGAHYRQMLAASESYRFSYLLHFIWSRFTLWRLANHVTSLRADELAHGSRNLQQIERMKSEVARDKAGFALMVFPELVHFSHYPYRNVVDLVSGYCVGHSIPVIDLLPALSKHRERDLWVHETDHHPNPVAHAIAAEALDRFLTATIPLSQSDADAPARSTTAGTK